MTTIWGLLGAFAIYWLVLFATCYIVVEYGHSYLYDEATPATGLKVLLGSALLAMMLTWTAPPSSRRCSPASCAGRCCWRSWRSACSR